MTSSRETVSCAQERGTEVLVNYKDEGDFISVDADLMPGDDVAIALYSMCALASLKAGAKPVRSTLNGVRMAILPGMTLRDAEALYLAGFRSSAGKLAEATASATSSDPQPGRVKQRQVLSR